MSRYDRWSSLLDLLARGGQVEVGELATQLGVSDATIRRDLDQLADQQMLVRTRGGAVANTVSYDLPLKYKTARHASEKQRIGVVAASLIDSGSTVALNGGTTSTEVAHALAVRADLHGQGPNTTVTVVTNALNIANELVVRPHVKIVVTGGAVRPQSYELIGPLVVPVLSELALDYAVLGVDAIDAENGASSHHEGEAATNRLMAANARTVIIIADSSKLGARAFARMCPIGDVDILVTSADADEQLLDTFREKGVRVITA
jgi:DeoR family transcriptional regulator of aga operon